MSNLNAMQIVFEVDGRPQLGTKASNGVTLELTKQEAVALSKLTGALSEKRATEMGLTLAELRATARVFDILKAINIETQISLYGVCPHCGGSCRLRERRLNGSDTCVNGHVYPSSAAVLTTRYEPNAATNTN
jgi:hypothetical protein